MEPIILDLKDKNIKDTQDSVGDREDAVLQAVAGSEWKKYSRVAMAALSVLPWVGSLLGAAATLSGENEQGKTNKIMYLWVKEHEGRLKELGGTLGSMFEKFELFGNRIKERIESEEYVGLVRSTFKVWDRAETTEKKNMLRKLITNAGGVSISKDDLIKMFIGWIEKYDEFHFLVIREVHQNPNITRRQMWMNIRGDIPTDSSAEADLFKLLIDDLTQGRVIRQVRDIDLQGRFLKKQRQKGNSSDSGIMKSPFDNVEYYELTDLGTEFVSYVMNDLTLQIEANK